MIGLRWRSTVAALMIAGCSAAATSPAARDPLPAAPGARAAIAATELEADIHLLINQHRQSSGLPAVRWDPRVAELARRHSREMARGTRPFGHYGFDERTAQIQQHLAVGSIAENVAYDSRRDAELARLVVEGWLASGGHRRNIEGDFSVAGVGVAESPDGVRFFTHIFVQTQ